ncbi:histone H3-like centromeric protein A isoform X2 [Sarcophilus harrisii]|uniref:histone H3-like centromeric protein A isoform X2 n=1 Tax=Sarcophilus harrisii TaxID=9305 RepID=UPI000C7D91E5|nr:histone H3-like centromeric protein A isoform X2 [Sarcophilus harrisii]
MRPDRRKSTPRKRLSTSSQPRASTSTAAPAGPSRRRRFPGRRGHRVLREIRKLQKSTNLLIRKAPFGRLVSIRESPVLTLRFLLEKYASDTLEEWTFTGKLRPYWPYRSFLTRREESYYGAVEDIADSGIDGR